jgi:transposase
VATGHALTQWFQRRFVAAGGRSKRIGIVAVERKLAIALWRYVEPGVVPEGAQLKASRGSPRARACTPWRRAARDVSGLPSGGTT